MAHSSTLSRLLQDSPITHFKSITLEMYIPTIRRICFVE